MHSRPTLLYDFLPLACALLAILGCEPGPDRSGAVAVVNKRKITLEAFENTMNRVNQLPGRSFSDINTRKELLKDMIDEELLFQQALKEDIVQKSDRLKREIVREYLVDKIGKGRPEPTEEEIRKYYEEKKNELERVRVSHILVAPAKPGDPESEKKAKQKAEALRAELKKMGATPEHFSAFAKKYSNDAGNKTQGGDLGFFTRDKMVSEFSRAAFDLKKINDVSSVTKTQFGYHLIQLTGDQRGFEFFRQPIKWKIAQEREKTKADELLLKLKSNASIEIFDDMLQKAASGTPTPPEEK